MKYTGSLVKREREQIFKLFLENIKLKFNEIEKETGIRSNMVSYHLEKMQKEGLLEKRRGYYLLTKNAEKYIPIFSNLIGKELSALPVILIALINKDKILLMKRNRRPYKNYWSMIGGKILPEEDFETASLRQIKEKTNLDCKYVSINSVLHERIKDSKMVKYSFILFFTKTITKKENFIESTHGKLKWFNLKDIGKKEKIIPSDLWLIKNKLNSKINIKEAMMLEREGNLSRFKILT